MSKDIIVLTPNGRRQKVTCTPDTTILKVLEDVCAKQGFQPTEYDLKHHNHILDLTTTVRFSNLPNKATLEMVEAERKRLETNVTIGLMLEDGERRTAEFSPNTSLLDLVVSLAPNELKMLQQPSVMYMRQEVTGIPALKEKTLRQLGLLGGRAILRLLNKAQEAKQANVSSVYRYPLNEKADEKNTVEETPTKQTPKSEEASVPGPSSAPKTEDFKNEDHKPFDPVKLIKQAKKGSTVASSKKLEIHEEESSQSVENQPKETTMIAPKETSSKTTQENLERRLKIEEEVTFIGALKAVAFTQPDQLEDELNDLPDDFYELTVEEVRRLYNDLQQHRLELEDSPLLIASKKEELEKQTSQQRMAQYKNVVVRVQFPDHIILQGVFEPSNTIQDVTNFIKEHLKTPNKPFHIFTTPIKETLDPKMTLLQAKFVPCVHMHFKWLDDSRTPQYLKEEIYAKQTTSDAAYILASKYRAPSRRKLNEPSPQGSLSQPATSSGLSSKLPKWLRR